MMKHTPPKIFLQFFHWYCDPKVLDYMLSLFRSGIIKPTEGYKNLNTCGMYKSYFKIEWRNLLKNKGSVISIGGLALAESFRAS